MKTKVVGVANQKGGVGKTTTVINLAASLAEMGQSILVVDLDPQANATSGLGVPQQKGASLYQALIGQGYITNLVQPTSVKGLDIIPSELDLAGSEVDIARLDAYLHCFRKVIEPMVQAELYNFILVDCPPSLGILSMNALTAADTMIVPMQCEYYALEGLSVINHLIKKLHESGANPRIAIEGILMTMYDGRTNLSAEVVAEVRKHFGDKVFRTIIPRNVRLSEAPSHGKSVIHYERNSTGAKAYKSFAKEFMEKQAQPPVETVPQETAPAPEASAQPAAPAS